MPAVAEGGTDAPRFIFGRLNTKWKPSATSGQTDNAVDKLRQELRAKLGRKPTPGELQTAYRKHIMRRVRGRLLLKLVAQNGGKVPTPEQFTQAVQSWKDNHLDTYMENVNRELGTEGRGEVGQGQGVTQKELRQEYRSQKAEIEDMRADVNKVLRAFAKIAAARATEKHGHLTSKPNEVQAIFDAERFSAEMEEALRPYVGRIVTTTVARVEQTGKAGLLDNVLTKLLKSVGTRVKSITETTRDTLAGTVRRGIEEGLSPAQLGDLIQSSSAFDEYRAEMIARTETGTLLNQAAVSSYQQMGVERVQVYDGDKDDICAAADGAIWTLDEAERSPLGHPNCTRDFAPMVGAA